MHQYNEKTGINDAEDFVRACAVASIKALKTSPGTTALLDRKTHCDFRTVVQVYTSELFSEKAKATQKPGFGQNGVESRQKW